MRRVFALVIMSVVLWSGTASSYALYRCRCDSVARRACCCAASGHRSNTAPAAAGGAAIGAPCCCDVETVTVAHAPSEAARAHIDIAPLPIVGVWPAAMTHFSMSRTPPAAEQPRGLGPPLILLKSSFQI